MIGRTVHLRSEGYSMQFVLSENTILYLAGLDWNKKKALAFLTQTAHHNGSDTTHQSTILAVPIDMRTIPRGPVYSVTLN